MTSHTTRIETAVVGERDIYAAAEAARRAGATHYRIEAPRPACVGGGYYIATHGRVAQPLPVTGPSHGEAGGNPIDNA